VELKKVGVSWTMSPVTQMDEVAVKRASTGDIWPDWVLKGSQRRKAPKKMANKKLMAKTWAG